MEGLSKIIENHKKEIRRVILGYFLITLTFDLYGCIPHLRHGISDEIDTSTQVNPDYPTPGIEVDLLESTQ